MVARPPLDEIENLLRKAVDAPFENGDWTNEQYEGVLEVVENGIQLERDRQEMADGSD